MSKTVVTTEEPVFVPEHAFSDFDINAHLKKNIVAKGYELPTPIQDKAIPHALLGQDVVGLAETGTGKTAAFLIPLIDKVMKQKGERVLVMAPTRELAVQIEKELAGFARG
ncbi:MAG: DEAD/DEAH box helicase, partial [Patescibacteria group bacterium]|nr:DEAD/DEAH box helicase [Patescibacteria group bacterium]